jgi:hypothetical protein
MLRSLPHYEAEHTWRPAGDKYPVRLTSIAVIRFGSEMCVGVERGDMWLAGGAFRALDAWIKGVPVLARKRPGEVCDILMHMQ